ncbi:hypothetical protein QBC36DRAFT_372790 [Triangularia setosa]|uniref:Extracellular serine-rich protein n=1 Tax=Triangularia setosa TaxID=2587417 RepID=A0AAN6W7T7_9PEZI|nr:hypothetical protein QBC36DRAFT_372790 [Podospora setosa]
MRFSTTSLIPLSVVGLAQAAHHQVTVGKGGELKFVPEVVKAQKHDTITYTFFAKNHSVAQSSFDKPCQPIDGAIFSGFVPNDSQDVASRTTFTIVVEDDRPIWLYCSQSTGDHCQKGMVHAINPPETGNTIEAYKEKAKDAPKSTSPHDGLPQVGRREIAVDVGKGGLKFDPDNIIEPVGTYVKFSFSPKNHSVVQSTFDKPCQFQEHGFSSGHIPTKEGTVSPATFNLQIKDSKPIWFYCAQPNGNHCQSGMVGSINAPTEGNTLAAFVNKAKTAPTPSTIDPSAPLGGIILVNGKEVKTFNGNELPAEFREDSNPSTTASATHSMPPAASQTLPAWGSPEVPDYFADKAGGHKPKHWNWADKLSPSASGFLQLHLQIENLITHLLWEAYLKLETVGEWKGVYPQTIVDAIGAWAAQSVLHSATTSTVMDHYEIKPFGGCKWKLPLDDGVVGFLEAWNSLNLVQIGALIDISAQIAKEDPFLVPVLLTQAGAKSRAAGVVNMMRGHLASVSPREIGVPVPLVWSYVLGNYVDSCPEEVKVEGLDKAWPGAKVANVEAGEDGVVTRVEVEYEGSGEHWVAWIGPWGELEYAKVEGGKKVGVPKGWTGDVFVVVVDKEGLGLGELAGHVVAGPEQVWL